MRYSEILPTEGKLLMELFDNTLPFSWETKSKDYWRGTFIFKGLEYHVSCILEGEGFEHPDDPSRDGDWWDLAFGLTSDGFSGTRVIDTEGGEFAIFSTVLKAFEEFLTAVKPEFFSISASKENPNRFPLYKHLLKRYLKHLTAMGYSQVSNPRYRHTDVYLNFDSLSFRRR